MKRVGFWYNKHETDLPIPIKGGGDWEDGAELRAVLAIMQLRMSNSNGFGLAEREAEPLGEVRQYKGFSVCRFCGCDVGVKEFTLGGFTWPEGFLHYLNEPHYVRPDPEFKQFIKDWAKDHITVGGKPLILK